MSEKNGERLDTDDKAPLGRLQTGTSGGVNGADAQTGQTGRGGSTPDNHHLDYWKDWLSGGPCLEGRCNPILVLQVEPYRLGEEDCDMYVADVSQIWHLLPVARVTQPE